ncbi:MAG: molybdopterin synthase [Halobacteriaceae archaeon]
MYVLEVIGSDDHETATMGEQIASHFTDRGRTALIHQDSQSISPDSVQTKYTVSDDGWNGAGHHNNSLSQIIDQIAPMHDYAVICGPTDLERIPTLVCGDVDVSVDPLCTYESVERLDVESVHQKLKHTEAYETLESLVQKAKESPQAEYAGAIATFTGRVRAKDDPHDEVTTQLTFEKYDEVANSRLSDIQEEIESRDGVYEVLLHHRTGTIEYGEDIVFVVVLAGHRKEAFQAVEDGINRLKDEVPIFKKETTVEEEYWRHQKQ